MRVLHVLESCAPGGIETTFLHVLRHLRVADESVRHDVLAFAGGPLEPRFREIAHDVTVGCDPATIDRTLSEPHELVYVLFERCAYRLLPHLLGRSSARVVYGKGYDMGGMYRLNEGLRWQADESMLAACDGVTFTTEPLARGFDLPPGRTTVLGKAADVSRFASLADPDSSVEPRILCVANVHPRKRVGDLVEALPYVARFVPNVSLRLVGGGGAEELLRLRQIAREHGVAGRVSIAGPMADVLPEVAAARIIALASSCEGVPTALLEAMAAGRPVVATRVGHVSSIVDDGVEGFLVAPGDAVTLADRLATLLGNLALARMMGQAARRRAAAHDVGAVAQRLLSSLQQVVASDHRTIAPSHPRTLEPSHLRTLAP